MIEGMKVRLRALRLSDAKEIVKYWNRFELRAYLASIVPHSVQDEEEFIKTSWKGFKTLRLFQFGIETLAEELLIGGTSLGSVDWVNRRAEAGITIWNEAYQGKGYGTEAMLLLLYYGFNVLNLHSVHLRVYAYNRRAIKSYLKIGFKEVGRWREARYLHGQYHDVILMDLLASEFQLPPDLEEALTMKYVPFSSE